MAVMEFESWKSSIQLPVRTGQVARTSLKLFRLNWRVQRHNPSASEGAIMELMIERSELDVYRKHKDQSVVGTGSRSIG